MAIKWQGRCHMSQTSKQILFSPREIYITLSVLHLKPNSCLLREGHRYFLLYFIVHAITVIPAFFPFAHLHPAPHPTPSANPHIIVLVHGSCINVLWLIRSPSFIQAPPPPPWQLSVCSMYLCLCFHSIC